MPVLDTPITTDDQNLKKILSQQLPVMLVFHRGDIDKPLGDALNKEAKKNSGNLLIARIHAGENPQSFSKYGEPPTPSLVTLTNRGKVKADAESVRPADIRNHVRHLLEDTPLAKPQEKQSSGGKRPIQVTDATFRKEVLKSKQPVLVDFWAQWCGPCHQIAPYIEQLAKEYGGKVKVAKLDVDANQVIARRYGIQSIPTMIIFEGGQPAQRITGANPVALRKAIERYAI